VSTVDKETREQAAVICDVLAGEWARCRQDTFAEDPVWSEDILAIFGADSPAVQLARRADRQPCSTSSTSRAEQWADAADAIRRGEIS
jgi:hypothetical protein